MRTIQFLSLVLLLLTGCSTIGVDGPDFQQTAKPASRRDAALVYVYRVGRGPDLRLGSVNISVDGKYVFGVKNKGFSFLYVRPGSHQFEAEWSAWEKPLFEEGHFDPKTLSVELEGGKTYFINYFVEQDTNPPTYAEKSSLIGKAFSKSHIISAGLRLEDEATGLANLSYCKYQSNDFR